ncbi:hypothetical protein [Neptunomonas concharum]|uniref:O-antigen polysaccharide polymerase Wzy n=1 Tax=Neptunomonas concharum TaxID=1031538 RepID=A0A5P1R8P1_9GAMM|nr:hypothetical protein [Neptunomonas concharum]QEQ95990.1 hypothetical protein F0U83_04310 [Neptunomonas concharum]
MQGFILSQLILLVSTFYLVFFEEVDIDIFFVFSFITVSILAKEAGDWLLGRRCLFDPASFVSIFSYVYFFFSPILQRHWQFWPSFPELQFYDGWLIFWSFLMMFGALIYRFSAMLLTPFMNKPSMYIYSFDKRRFYFLSIVFTFIGALSQLFIYIKFGGVSGFMNTFTERQDLSAAVFDPFSGMGVQMLLADGYRNAFAVLLVVYFMDKPVRNKWWFFPAIILIMVFVNFIFGGLKGSRGAVVYSLFWGVGMYHFFIKKISIKYAVSGILFLFVFLNSYYWYKFAGLDGLQAIWDSEYRSTLNQGLREENVKFVLSRDLGRMDFQTLTLRKVLDDDFDLSLGRSYISSIFSIIPDSLLSQENKMPSITKEKTELIFGSGSYVHGDIRATTNLLGQYGELFVNFGLVGGFAFFTFIAFFVTFIKKFVVGLDSKDVRLLLVPMLSLLVIKFFMYDSAVFSQFLLRNFIYIMPLYAFSLVRNQRG